MLGALSAVIHPALLPAANTAENELRDKTLVVWAQPANLTQRGGSALTIDDLGSHFDGIVFGEILAGRWMPGSDFYRRTQQEQTTWPAETTPPDAWVQVAITYAGQQVTVYRNARQYAAYTMENPPQSFGPQSAVVIGMRHLDQGDHAHFAGRIQDARIYDRALTASEIGALKADDAAGPAPWAWWTFDDADAADRMGRFAEARLVGGATIEDGALVLDGKSACFVAGRTDETLQQAAVAATPPASLPGVPAARELRAHLLQDRFRAGYHFVIPEGRAMPFDPNGAVYWKGRYHLFYIFQDARGHNWGHVSSTDLFHWRHHPTGLVAGMFSGNCFINQDGRPTMCYHQVGQGNAMAVALDDDLNEWQKLDRNPITPPTEPGDPFHEKYQSWDPYGWVEDGSYYAIFGGKHPAVARAPTLAGEWRYVGDLLANAADGVPIDEDVSCADFFTLGNTRMLLCISHALGCRYYLGDWRDEQFHPRFHEKMSWADNSFFAPESLLDDRGRRIMWAWVFDGPGFQTRAASGWSGTMSLPRVLSLDEAGRLRMNPPREVEELRYNPRSAGPRSVEADGEVPLPGVQGDSLELAVEMRAPDAARFGVKVGCSPGGEEQTLIYYDASTRKLCIDTRRSSLTEGPKSIEAGPFSLADNETLRLRVFVDRSVVEVFANDGRQAVMRRVYPSRTDSLGVTLFSDGGPARATRIEAWDMMPANPY
ncbi:MAG: GH32 C-terminal domain-containing protein [Verrucomicrobiales bacterium]|nr:GH32 C-terminal domain-containing protein [Verrucomicrobiales bacterium]